MPDSRAAPAGPTGSAHPSDRAALIARYDAVRSVSDRLAAPLSPADRVVQSMPDASPTKWHLAHVTWFFETVILEALAPGYTAFDPAYAYLFNSYYESLGERHPRPQRGLLTRPDDSEIAAYRAHVDAGMHALAETAPDAVWRRAAPLIVLGLHHEQQHQELLLMDILHAFSCNPLRPAYADPAGVPAPGDAAGAEGALPDSVGWIDHPGGLIEIGFDPETSADGFAFDNERPRHKVWLEPFRLADRPVTNLEWLAFIEDGGYETATLWLSDGWQTVCEQGWTAPLYWERRDGAWTRMTLRGPIPLDLAAPVSHVSYYEADAFARWAGARLPTEAEWEVMAARCRPSGNLLDTGALMPGPAHDPTSTTFDGEAGTPRQMFGDVWEWTASAYSPYPGFRPAAGAVGEYNGKFMCSQQVLRGGCCLTPADHVRASYRNFFYPHQRWQVAGLRLAADEGTSP